MLHCTVSHYVVTHCTVLYNGDYDDYNDDDDDDDYDYDNDDNDNDDNDEDVR